MAWKKSTVVALLLCVLLVAACRPITARASYTVYDGTISSTYITYFRDILSGMSPELEYVAFRSGQYDYIMFVGKDIQISGTRITGSDLVSYKFSTNSGYNNTLSYSVDNVGSVNLNVGDNLIYSSLGNYPRLVESEVTYEYLQTLTLCIIALVIVVNRIITGYRKSGG